MNTLKHVISTRVDEVDIPEGIAIEIEWLEKTHDDRDWLVYAQAIQIRELQDQLADYEQELYELDLEVDKLHRASNSVTTNENYSENSYEGGN